jgi:hypothetical protein
MVKKVFMSISNDTSAGPDRIEIKTLKNVDPDFSVHSLIFNIQLAFGQLLPQWQQGRLCLIPKAGKDLNSLSNWRPLSIYNIGLRALMKLVTRVVFPYTNLHPAQKGFMPGENAVDNVYKVRNVIKHAMKTKQQLWITAFDAKAAFDSGSREHMKECIKRLRLPLLIEKIYLQSLEPTQVKCTHRGISVPPVKVVNGVGQGRPESSLTFNLSIDYLIRHLADNVPSSYKVDEDNEVKVLAYADDIITFASSRDQAISQAQCVVEMLKLIGMEINVDKCICLAINLNQAHSSPTLSEDYPIPVTIDEYRTFKYLGCHISANGQSVYSEWTNQIAGEIKSLIDFPFLMPWQKIDIMRTFIISQLPYKSQIEAEDQPHQQKDVLKLVETAQQAIKSILGLQCLPLKHIYGSKPAGLSCPNAFWSIITNSLITLSRIKDSNDDVLISLNEQLNIDYATKINGGLNALKNSKTFEDQLDLSQLTIILSDNKKCKSRRIIENLRKQSISQWISTPTGISAGTNMLCKSIVVKSAVEYAVNLTESQFKGLIQIRSGCSNLRTRPHQKLANNGDITCRLCKSSMESMGHVLGECPQLHKMIIARHDTVVDILFKHLSKSHNATAIKEPAYNINGQIYKPDIVFQNNTNNTITIIDPTVRTEKDQKTREDQVIQKIQKYEVLRHHLANEYNLPLKQVAVCPVWLGARGTILKCDIDLLEKHVGKLPKQLIQQIANEVVSWTATIYNSVVLRH